MAQTSPVRDGGQSNNTAKTSSTTNTEKATAPASTPRKGFFSSLLSPSSAPSSATQAGADGQKKPAMSGLIRFTFVLVLFMFVIQALQVGLVLADNSWHLGLRNYVTTNHSTPVIGGLHWLDLIFFLIVAAFYIALIKFKILPRDLFGARARTTAAQQARAPIERPAGSGKDRSRAARRRAAELAAAAAAAKAAKNSKGGKKAAPAPESAKVTASVSDAQASGDHDEEYYRVKAAQRLQRRRAGKR